MDINNKTLEFFNENGLDYIASSIEEEFERLIEEDYFEEGQQEFKKELISNLEKLSNINTEYELFDVLCEVVDWLNIPDNTEAFGSEGWEHSCGLDSV
jgi:hypothetical protein